MKQITQLADASVQANLLHGDASLVARDVLTSAAQRERPRQSHQLATAHSSGLALADFGVNSRPFSEIQLA